MEGHEFSELDFLTELSVRTGCGLLLDVNNVHISAHNLGFDAATYLDAFPAKAIVEIHLAGRAVDPGDKRLLIDTHDAPIADNVWLLYQRVIERIGIRPTLIERDDNIPGFDVLLAERDRAQTLLNIGKKRSSEVTTLIRVHLRCLSHKDLARSRLEPRAAFRWAWFPDQPVYTIWRLNREQRDIPDELDWRGEGALLTRKQGRVCWEAVSAADCTFLDACAAYLPIELAAEKALEVQSDLDLSELIARLFSTNAFVAVNTLALSED